MICGKCGLATPEGFKFCPKCGASLERPVKVDRGKIKGPRDAILKVIRARDSTDKIVPPSWIWVMLIVYLISIIVSTAIAFSVAIDVVQQNPSDPSRDLLFDEIKKDYWLSIMFTGIFYILAAALAYSLISRLNKHYARDHELRAASLNLISTAASSPTFKLKVGGELFAMSQTDDLISSEEKMRSPIFWSLAVATPFLVSVLQSVAIFTTDNYHDYQSLSGWFLLASLLSYMPLFYLSYFLGKSISEHHDEWMDFADQTATAVNELGLKKMEPHMGRSMLRRSYALYALVTIVTLGFFMFYWWHTLIRDTNYHFKAHRDFEDKLALSIRD